MDVATIVCNDIVDFVDEVADYLRKGWTIVPSTYYCELTDNGFQGAAIMQRKKTKEVPPKQG